MVGFVEPGLALVVVDLELLLRLRDEPAPVQVVPSN